MINPWKARAIAVWTVVIIAVVILILLEVTSSAYDGHHGTPPTNTPTPDPGMVLLAPPVEVTNIPPPYSRPTPTPGGVPVDPYQGEMEVRCVEIIGTGTWQCHVHVITHGKLTMLGMSNYKAYTFTSEIGEDWWSMTFSFYGVECDDIAAEFVLLTNGYPPYIFPRHTAKKLCNFLPLMLR